MAIPTADFNVNSVVLKVAALIDGIDETESVNATFQQLNTIVFETDVLNAVAQTMAEYLRAKYTGEEYTIRATLNYYGTKTDQQIITV